MAIPPMGNYGMEDLFRWKGVLSQLMGNYGMEDLSRWKEILSQLSPEQLYTIIQNFSADEERAQAVKYHELAMKDQDYPMPQGQQIGEHWVAPNPIEFLVSSLRRSQGMDLEKQQLAKLDELNQRNRAYGATIFGAASRLGSNQNQGFITEDDLKDPFTKRNPGVI